MAIGGTITTANSPKALWPGVKAWWGQVYDEHAVEYTDLFDSDTSSQNYEELVQMTGFGLAPQKTEGQGITYDSEVQGFVTRLTHVVYGLGYIVTEEEIEDNLYDKVSRRRAASLAMSLRQTKEHIGANIYNRAFNTSYTGGDGVTLCNTAHPNTTGGTWSNRPAVDADLSEAALEDAVIALMGYTNDRGLLINVMPRSLHIARQEHFNATRILKSVYRVETANNDINALVATNAFPGGAVLNHYFTAAHAWFIRTNVREGMMYLERRAVKFDQDNDFDTTNLKYKGTERYSFGWGDARAVYGSNGP